MEIEYRVIDDLAQLAHVPELEARIWGLDAADTTPVHILHTLSANGGAVVAAYNKTHMIGMALGFPARRGSKWFLWSHMAGVHPDFQGMGIGTQIKHHQRLWATQNGYRFIRWTYDPLQRGNANFNIHTLGATANIYHVNYYGEMTDGINAGLPSDRLEVIWQTDKIPPELEKLRVSSDQFILLSDEQQRPTLLDFTRSSSPVLVEIPSNLSRLKQANPGLALDWLLAVRESLQHAFAQHYTIVDFISLDKRFAYVLAPSAPWFMYVVGCSDQTLYTGITNNLERRIKQHNTGKGAAYTRARRPVKLLAAWQFKDRSSALKAEAAFKKQSKQAKVAQIELRSAYCNGDFINL